MRTACGGVQYSAVLWPAHMRDMRLMVSRWSRGAALALLLLVAAAAMAAPAVQAAAPVEGVQPEAAVMQQPIIDDVTLLQMDAQGQ